MVVQLWVAEGQYRLGLGQQRWMLGLDARKPLGELALVAFTSATRAMSMSSAAIKPTWLRVARPSCPSVYQKSSRARRSHSVLASA
ncbi:hypothetical protein [Billgrantia tianxiuensis]|uniref:hypothetical protein n=1 Tax=Billgrantia tianxiuensis TaxID=2497861 RepID=UPI0030EB4B2B